MHHRREENDMTDDFIGRGFPFPLRIDERGSMALVSGIEELERSMTVVISTAPGERPFRPRFGCRIWELMFEPINEATMGLMEMYVEEALRMWEPRVDIDQILVEPASVEGAVMISVSYVVRSTNDRRNLVYPFYTIPPEEES
jgi:phage baseplate assembly protein W